MNSAKKLNPHLFNSDPTAENPISDVPSIIEIQPVGKKQVELNPEQVAVEQNKDIFEQNLNPVQVQVDPDEHTVTIWTPAPKLVGDDDVVPESLFTTVMNLSRQLGPTLRQSIEHRPKLAKREFQQFLDRLTVQEQNDRRVLKNGVRLAIEVLGFDYVLECNLSHPEKLADQVFALNDHQQKTGLGIVPLKEWIAKNPDGWYSDQSPNTDMTFEFGPSSKDQDKEDGIFYYPIDFHYSQGAHQSSNKDKS